MKRSAMLLLLVFSLILSSSVAMAFGLNPKAIRAAIAKALHSPDPAVKEAAKIIQAKGLLKPGLSLPDLSAALQDEKVRKAVELLQKKGIVPKVPLPKASETQRATPEI